MSVSLQRIGFLRLFILVLAAEIAHAVLQFYWPEIRVSRLGPRPKGAILFLATEALLVLAALAAGFDRCMSIVRSPDWQLRDLVSPVFALVALLVIGFVIWN